MARQKHVPRSPSDASRSFCGLRDTADARAAPTSESEPQRARALQKSTDALFLKEVPGPVLRAPQVAELWVRRGRTDSRNSVASKRAWPPGSVSDAGRARSPTETFGATRPTPRGRQKEPPDAAAAQTLRQCATPTGQPWAGAEKQFAAICSDEPQGTARSRVRCHLPGARARAGRSSLLYPFCWGAILSVSIGRPQ